jgi:hypothetical protein
LSFHFANKSACTRRTCAGRFYFVIEKPDFMQKSLLAACLLFPFFLIAQNVGINNDNPQARLHINGGDLVVASDTGFGIVRMHFLVGRGGAFRVGQRAPVLFEGGQFIDQWNGFSVGIASFAANQANIASGNVSTAFGSNTRATNTYAFATGRTTEANGELTTTFGLETIANSYGSVAMGRWNVSDGNSAAWLGSDPLLTIGNGSSNANRSNALTLRKDGRLGLNNASPNYLLTLDDAGLGIHRPAANTMTFMTGSAERMRLTSAGRVGIGTNNPQTLVEISSASVPNLRIHNTSGGAVQIDLMRAGTGSVGLDWRVHNPNGVLLFGRSTDDLATVTDFYQFSNIRFRPVPNDELALGQSAFRWTTLFCVNPVNASSDARLKTDINPLQYGLKEVMQMQPVSYRWKKDDAPEKMLGFLAQDMLGIIPEVVTTGETNDEMMGMAYTELIPVLVKAMQELKEENDALRLRLEQLEME